MNEIEKKIADTLKTFGETPNTNNVWRVQGQPVIRHHCLERIANKAKLIWEMPQILRCESEEAVILAAARMNDRLEWSIGEAKIGANYRISGKQAPYVYAMAEKRAKDRVILKLIELHGLVLSDAEADDLDQKNADPETKPATKPAEPTPDQIREAIEKKRQQEAPKPDDRADKIIAAMKRRTSWELAQEYIELDPVQKALDEMPTPDRNRVMDALKIHMESLGWKPTQRQANEEPHESATLPEDAVKRAGIVSDDPHHKTNLVTLPTRCATAIKDAKTAEEVDDLINKLLETLKIDWNLVPQDIKDEIDRVAHKRTQWLRDQNSDIVNAA